MQTLENLLQNKTQRNKVQLGQRNQVACNFKTVTERSKNRSDNAQLTDLSKALHLKLDQVNRSVNISLSARTRVVHSSIDEHYNQLHNYVGETQQVPTADVEVKKHLQHARYFYNNRGSSKAHSRKLSD